MAVPRNRMSNARKNSKRAHQAKKPKTVSSCQNCGQMKLPHVVCTGCNGYGHQLAFMKQEAAAE
jgi:large subunit ribosomal protein L32